MEQFALATRDETIANPFGIRSEGPLPCGRHVPSINPKVPESTDLGMFGTRHPTDGG